MKGKKKVLVTALCVALIAVGALAGTMAYFTDKDTAVNTFTVGRVGITLDEAEVTADGTPVDGAVRVKANEYHLVPGQTYTKDPTVHVDADSEDCYLFVVIDNQIAGIEGGKTVAAQLTANGWKMVKEGKNGIVYAYKDAVSGGTDVIVFESFTIDGDGVSNGDLAKHNKQAITVTAYAVQAAGFGSASEAWAATFGV